MNGKQQSRSLRSHMISRAAMAAMAMAVISALTFALSQSAQAQAPATGAGQTELILHSFSNNGSDGSHPFAGLIFDAAGNLYGTTEGGGPYGNYGTVFELTPTGGGGWTEQVLYSFNLLPGGGAYPTAGLIFDGAGNLYGTTSGGGSSHCYNGCGTVFELSSVAGGGWMETMLYSFCPQGGVCPDGDTPNAGLIFDAAGNLYGTTQGGGTYGSGTVFELSPAGGGNWTETVLHSFNRDGTDGFQPFGGVIFDAAGNLYGTTPYGGTTTDTSDGGTAFELSPTAGGTWIEQVLHNFGNGADGAYSYSGLIFDAAGNLYGTTYGGGSYSSCSYYGHGDVGCGTVFELSPTAGGGWTEQVLHNFDNGVGGFAPWAGVIFDAAGNLYGTAVRGGSSGSWNCVFAGCGTIFELTPTAGGNWTEQLLHNFGNGTDGYSPTGGVITDAAGNLYGTTQSGGTYGWEGGTYGFAGGTVFELTPADPCATCRHAIRP